MDERAATMSTTELLGKLRTGIYQFHGVTFDLSGQFDAAGHLPSSLEKICCNVEHSGVSLATIGIRTDAHARLVADLGATYLGGPRIGPPGEAPANMVRYGWNDLMAGRCPL
jgi:hypothetical protein